MPWIGRKKRALVPMYRPNAHPPDVIPQVRPNQILRRRAWHRGFDTKRSQRRNGRHGYEPGLYHGDSCFDFGR